MWPSLPPLTSQQWTWNVQIGSTFQLPAQNQVIPTLSSSYGQISSPAILSSLNPVECTTYNFKISKFTNNRMNTSKLYIYMPQILAFSSVIWNGNTQINIYVWEEPHFPTFSKATVMITGQAWCWCRERRGQAVRRLALPTTQKEKHFTYDHKPRDLLILLGN